MKKRFNDAITLLTEFIIYRTKDIEFITMESTTNNYEEFIKVGLPYQISLEGNDSSIYGNSYINTLGRVWHDDIHYWHKLNFSYEDECKVYGVQAMEFLIWSIGNSRDKQETLDGMQILYEDIVGQYEYYEKNGKFVEEQYKFVYNKFKTKVKDEQ